MTLEGVRNLCIRRGEAPVDLSFADGRISSIGPGAGATASVEGALSAADLSGRCLDAGGRAALPGLIDAHVHIDKAFQLSALERSGLPVGTLADAISSTAQVRRRGLDVQAAERLLTRMSRRGTTAARLHVEIDPRWGIESVEQHVQLSKAWASRMTLQLVAFPQNGLSAETLRLMDEALGAGCEVVGGCPYVDADPVAHVDAVFELARRHNRPIDFHVDLSDDPADAVVEVVSDRTQRYGWGGRVVVGHATSLSAAPPEDAAARMRHLAAAGVAVVALPATDLYLSGRAATHAKPRGLAPLTALLGHGVAVALGTNNVQNAFTPYGNGGLLPMAWLAGLVGHFPPGNGHAQLLDMITAAPARILGLGGGVIAVGHPADLVVVDSDDPLEAVSGPAEVLAVVYRGQLVAGQL